MEEFLDQTLIHVARLLSCENELERPTGLRSTRILACISILSCKVGPARKRLTHIWLNLDGDQMQPNPAKCSSTAVGRPTISAKSYCMQGCNARLAYSLGELLIDQEQNLPWTFWPAM